MEAVLVNKTTKCDADDTNIVSSIRDHRIAKMVTQKLDGKVCVGKAPEGDLECDLRAWLEAVQSAS